MIIWLLACALLAPSALWAQLRLFAVEGQSERLIVGSHDLGTVEAGETLERALRVRNAGLTSARLETLSVAGTGFALAGGTLAPQTLAPGAALDFGVRFQASVAGAYSTLLSLNAQTVLLMATALPAPAVFLEREGAPAALSTALPVDFGAIEWGTRANRRFRLENQTRLPLSVDLSVTGVAFSGPAGLPQPVSLGPGEAAPFEVFFEPQASGPHQGALRVNRRTFQLQGTGLDPPFPRPRVFFEPPDAGSGRQVRVWVRLASASRLDGRGELRIELQPTVQGFADDTAIVFLDTRSRSTPFSVLRGEEAAYFGPRQDVWIQTGTTAGRIVLTAQLGELREQTTLTLNPLPVVIDSLEGKRRDGTVEVSLMGFDNTRSASQIAFTFFDAAGQALAPGRIAVDAAAEFRRFFESSTLGGAFALRAAFPVIGDASTVAAFEVELTNSAGVTRSQRVTIRP